MFANSAGKDPLDGLRFMADQGFTAFEDNGMMRRTPGAAAADGRPDGEARHRHGRVRGADGRNNSANFTSGKPEDAGNFVKACTEAVDVAKRCNAKWMTVVQGNYDRRLPTDMQTAHVVDTLRAGADVLAKANLVMVLEPLADSPDLFLRFASQGYMICRAVNSPACKILFDMSRTASATRGTSSATST